MSKSEEQFKCGYEVREAKMVWTLDFCRGEILDILDKGR